MGANWGTTLRLFRDIGALRPEGPWEVYAFEAVMWLASYERPLERNELARARAAARLGFPERQVRVARLGSLPDPPAARFARSR